MKVKPQDADRFAKAPDASAAAVLVYGPDPGLAHERLIALTRAWLGDAAADDPFAVLDLTVDDVAKDPSRLADEANAMTLMGGRRVIRLRDADDKTLKAATELINQVDPTQTENRVVMTAGDLTPRSGLRKLFEGAKTGAALACYVEDERQLAAVIGQRLREAGKQSSRDLIDVLAARLVGDRALMSRELDKLLIYMGDDETLTPNHIAETVGDEADLSLDDAVMAAMGGDIAGADRALHRLWAQDTSPVAILRALQRHLGKLYPMAIEVGNGKPAKAVVDSARPPIFFKLKGAYEGQLRSWNVRKLNQAIERALETEGLCKQTGQPERALTERCFWATAQLARRRG
ncbi:MAG: DNA polymerase III subunit delta [Alphaproteobacteria bacterium]|nr:DNA polymerase III subunit delta [Alphaproteobacteria bacterium SS10]